MLDIKYLRQNIDFVVGKVISVLGFPQDLFAPWGGATE